ncbi:hypothetical protein HK405_001624, partial [Cladochytrium tenue]
NGSDGGGRFTPDLEDDFVDRDAAAARARDRDDELRATAFHTHAVAGTGPTLRERVAFYIDSSAVGRGWRLLDFVLNAVLLVSYINLTVIGPSNIPMFYHQVDAMLTAALLVQWLPMQWLSLVPDTSLTPFELFSWIAILPVLAAYMLRLAEPSYWGTILDAGNFAYLYPFRFWRFHLTLLRVVRPG